MSLGMGLLGRFLRWSRLREERGMTLVELIAAMAIMAIVATPLVASFTSALRHDVDQARKEIAYQNARLALQRLREDIHCATGVTSVEQNAYGGFTLTLAQANQQSPKGWCPSVIPVGSTSSGVQWCSIPLTDPDTGLPSTSRFGLFRFLGDNPTDCDGGAGKTFEVDYLAATPGIWPTNTQATGLDGGAVTSWVGNLWPTSAPCPTGHLPTIAVDFNIALDPVGHPDDHYELIDEIALRNANRCL